jgi:carbon storage regulator
MLILSRKLDEKIIIADDIVLTVVDISSDKVKIGIEADRSVSIHRAEVYRRMQAERAEGEPTRPGIRRSERDPDPDGPSVEWWDGPDGEGQGGTR